MSVWHRTQDIARSSGLLPSRHSPRRRGIQYAAAARV